MYNRQIFFCNLANRTQLLIHLTLRTFSVGSDSGGESAAVDSSPELGEVRRGLNMRIAFALVRIYLMAIQSGSGALMGVPSCSTKCSQSALVDSVPLM